MNTIDKRVNLATLAIPIFFENFLRMLLNNVNIFMVGKYSQQAVGAIGVSTQVSNLLLMVYGTLAFGTAVIIAQNLGAGHRDTAAKAANVAIFAGLGVSVVFSLSVSVFAGGILRMLNLPPELMQYGRPYLTIIGAASVCQALISIMSAIARNYGQTRVSMLVVLGMNIVNVTGNCLVIYRPFGLPDFGIYGIAVSTVLSQVLAVLVMFRILFVHMDNGLMIYLPKPFPFDMLKKIFMIGVPGGGDALFFTAAQIVTTYIITMIGSTALTAMVYMQGIIQFVQVTGFSIGQAAQIMVAHMVGAGDEKRPYKVCYRSLWLAMVLDMAVIITFYIFARKIIGIYTDDTAIINIAVTVLGIDIFLEPGRTFNLVTGNALRGTGDVVWPLVASVASLLVISIPCSYIFGVYLKLGLPGVYIAFAADELIRGQFMHLRWRSHTWVSKKVVKSPEIELEIEYAK